MKHRSLVFFLIAFSLVGCGKTGAPAGNVEPQAERKDQQSVSPVLALWSPEFKEQTLKGCINRATQDMNSEGVRRCKCVIEKAATTIPEERFKAIGTDPQVKESLRQIGAAC
jgi:hypothetical protein